MSVDFLKRFIEKEQYQQNSLLSVDEFISYCKKRGIETNEQELEFFESEGLLYPFIRIDRPIDAEEWIKFYNEYGIIYCRPAAEGLKEGEREIEKYWHRYYSSYNFCDRNKEMLIEWIDKDYLYDPSTKAFQKWSSFKGEEIGSDRDKIVSLYISYQIYILDISKKVFSININLARDRPVVSSSIVGGYCMSTSNGSFTLNKIDDFCSELKRVSEMCGFEKFFDLEAKKSAVKKEIRKFNPILELLVSIQNVYAPYGRSDAKRMRLICSSFDEDTWEDKKRNFNANSELEFSNVNIRDVFYFYQILSQKSIDLMGDGRAHDWIQLWKNIRWDKKDLLKGNSRLGIEYVQWALMLKNFIEDHLGREILDIDEVVRTDIDYALNINPCEIQPGSNLRGNRNYRLSDDDKSYYNHIYKRLFFLANDFGLDYQPRVIVLVEGATEEAVLPKFFEWCCGKPEYFGIEILNFRGVDKLLSTSKTAKDLRHLVYDIQKDIKGKVVSRGHEEKLNDLIKTLGKVDIVISNWTSFINFNLEKWQIIPIFVSDNEGNIKHFLEAEKPIRFKNKNYNVPNDWKFIWGIDNDDKPLKGNSFEFANYTDEEIALAVSEVLREDITKEFVGSKRENCSGINKIDKRIKIPENKKKINIMLYKNLLRKYNETDDSFIFERPIFKLIEKIYLTAELNHPPVDRRVEVENKKRIEEILNGARHL